MINLSIPQIVKGRTYYSARRALMNFYFNSKVYSGAFDKTKSIYIHIPKAAGTSISQALYGYDPRHLDLWRYQARNARKFDEYYKFTFVRNPYTRLASAYFHILKKYDQIHWRDIGSPFHVLKECQSFEQFAVETLSTENIVTTQFFKPQVEFLSSRDGISNLFVNYVGRFENINEDFKEVSGRLGLRVDLPHKNTGVSRDYKRLFRSKEVRDKIWSVYSSDFGLFGYDREDYPH